MNFQGGIVAELGVTIEELLQYLRVYRTLDMGSLGVITIDKVGNDANEISTTVELIKQQVTDLQNRVVSASNEYNTVIQQITTCQSSPECKKLQVW